MIDFALQVLASAFTAAAWWKMGDKARYAPALAATSEVVWLVMIIHGKLWGLLPLTLCLLYVHARNSWKWKSI